MDFYRRQPSVVRKHVPWHSSKPFEKNPPYTNLSDQTRQDLRELVEDIKCMTIDQSIQERCTTYFPQVIYQVAWELRSYVDEQLGGNWKDLSDVITLTGNLGETIAMTCSDYASFRWPRTGTMVLESINKWLESTYSGERSEESARMNVSYSLIHCNFTLSYLTLDVWRIGFSVVQFKFCAVCNKSPVR